MPCVGKARVGHKAPDFKLEAVVDGDFKDISLDAYIKDNRWVILLFIPAAFSFVCPSEVLAFHNCVDEFIERDCEIVFVSTDSKHCLWQWQHIPRKMGGLGKVRVALASDQSHSMSRDYGVLLEDKGMDLRGMYIIDPKGIIQQVTINNIAVGRSVLEALRLVEAFKAAAEKGVLCPANWRPGEEALVETYDDAAHNMLREMADVQVKDLDKNISRHFDLVMPADVGTKQHTSTMSASMHGTPHTNTTPTPHKPRSTNSIGSTYQASTAMNNRVITLEFSDPLTNPHGQQSPHEYMSVKEIDNYGSERGDDSAASTSSSVQRGLDVLKRMSTGWSSPLASPSLNGLPTVQNKNQSVTSALRTGYFD